MFIYVLKCPLTGDVRYVGKATNKNSRLRQHLSEARLNKIKSHKCAWIRSLLGKNLRPKLEVDLEIPKHICWKQAEIDRIAFYRSIGCNLTNSTNGGDEPGLLTNEGRKILSERASAQFGSLEARERQRLLMKSLCADPEFLKRRTAAMKAARSTPEAKARNSERSKALWRKPEHREKMTAARARLNADPAFRKKLAESISKAQSDPEIRKSKSEKARAAWKNPEIRLRQTQAIRKACRSSVSVSSEAQADFGWR